MNYDVASLVASLAACVGVSYTRAEACVQAHTDDLRICPEEEKLERCLAWLNGPAQLQQRSQISESRQTMGSTWHSTAIDHEQKTPPSTTC